MIEEVFQVLSWHKLTHTGPTSWNNPQFSFARFWATRKLRIILSCWYFNSVCKNVQMYTESDVAVKSGFRVSFTSVKMRTHRTAAMYPWWVCFYLMIIPCTEWKLQMMVCILPQMQTTLCCLLKLGIHEEKWCKDSDNPLYYIKF